MRFWNYNEILTSDPLRDAELLGRGVATADILVSNNGIDFSTLIPGQAFQQAPGDQLVDFSESVALNTDARYVRLNVLSNHGDAGFVGISEVQFFAVPEPGVFALLSVVLAGAVWRRRRTRR
jgi:hypothetical protein